MVRWVRDRTGKTYEVDWALRNAHKIGYPRAYIEAVLSHSHREPDGTVHVTSMVGCMKRNVFKMKKDYTVDLEGAANTMVGTSIHDYISVGDIEHKVSIMWGGIEITGSIDIVENHVDGMWLYDMKAVKSFKAKKTLGFYKVDVPVLDSDGNPVLYKSGPRAGQAKTVKETRQDENMVDALDYEQQLNAYRYMLEDQIDRGDDPVHGRQKRLFEDEGKVSNLFIFFILKDFGKDSKMNGLESNTISAPIKMWDTQDIEKFLSRSEQVNEALYGTGKLPDCPTDPRDNWNGRMCESFCEFKDQCDCGGSE